MAALRTAFVALENRNFRLFWSGQLVSTTGSMMQNAAVLWHVSLLVDPAQKAFALGLVGLVKVVPILGLSLLSGVVADAHDRRRLMIGTQSAMAVIAAILAWITFRGLDSAWPIYVLTALSSAASAFDGPARQSLVPELVPAHHFANAISLNTILFQTASVVGFTLSGVVLASFGIGWVYAVNASSFLFVIGALLAMRGVPVRAAESRTAVSLASALEGLKFVFSAPLIRSSMLLDFFATFFASAMALLPIYAQDILKVGPSGYGWLYAAPSVGAMFASWFLVSRAGRIERRGAWLLWAVVVYGIATIVFGVSTSFALTFACLALTGAADTVSIVLRNIIRQLSTPDSLRGRMTGVNMIFFLGGPQLGELEAGWVAQAFGAPFSVVTGGIGCLVAAAWIAWKTPELVNYRTDAPAPP
jgi:MFS family permease